MGIENAKVGSAVFRNGQRGVITKMPERGLLRKIISDYVRNPKPFDAEEHVRLNAYDEELREAREVIKLSKTRDVTREGFSDEKDFSNHIVEHIKSLNAGIAARDRACYAVRWSDESIEYFYPANIPKDLKVSWS